MTEEEKWAYINTPILRRLFVTDPVAGAVIDLATRKGLTREAMLELLVEALADNRDQYRKATAGCLVQGFSVRTQKWVVAPDNPFLNMHIEEEGGRWFAGMPALPGVHAYGATQEVAEHNVRMMALDALAAHAVENRRVRDLTSHAARSLQQAIISVAKHVSPNLRASLQEVADQAGRLVTVLQVSECRP